MSEQGAAMELYGRPRFYDERLSERIVLIVTPSQAQCLMREAREAGHRSLAAYIREVRLFPVQDRG